MLWNRVRLVKCTTWSLKSLILNGNNVIHFDLLVLWAMTCIESAVDKAEAGVKVFESNDGGTSCSILADSQIDTCSSDIINGHLLVGLDNEHSQNALIVLTPETTVVLLGCVLRQPLHHSFLPCVDYGLTDTFNCTLHESTFTHLLEADNHDVGLVLVQFRWQKPLLDFHSLHRLAVAAKRPRVNRQWYILCLGHAFETSLQATVDVFLHFLGIALVGVLTQGDVDGFLHGVLGEGIQEESFDGGAVVSDLTHHGLLAVAGDARDCAVRARVLPGQVVAHFGPSRTVPLQECIFICVNDKSYSISA